MHTLARIYMEWAVDSFKLSCRRVCFVWSRISISQILYLTMKLDYDVMSKAEVLRGDLWRHNLHILEADQAQLNDCDPSSGLSYRYKTVVILKRRDRGWTNSLYIYDNRTKPIRKVNSRRFSAFWADVTVTLLPAWRDDAGLVL